MSALGLDVTAVKNILDSDDCSKQVRAEQKISLESGINPVPGFIVNSKYSISGRQTADVFKQALKQIAQEA